MMASFCNEIEFELVAKARIKWWDNNGTNSNPEELLKEVSIPHELFSESKELKSSVKEIFGKDCLDYILGVIAGHLDYLPRLPSKVLVAIIAQLSVQDILSVSVTNKQLNQVCQTNELWEKLFRRKYDHLICTEIMNVAELLGWQKLFREVYSLSQCKATLRGKEIIECLKQKLLSADDSMSDMSGDSA